MGIGLEGILLGVPAAWAQNAPSEQCSLAVVSRWISADARVCDSQIVHEMALRGHAFAQNQMGMASILAIGPAASAKEAPSWFGQAPQGCNAPAPVSLARVHMSAWGTHV